MQDGIWIFRLSGGATSDGQSYAGSVTWKLTEDGQTLRETGQLSLDGEMLDPINATLYRVNE